MATALLLKKRKSKSRVRVACKPCSQLPLMLSGVTFARVTAQNASLSHGCRTSAATGRLCVWSSGHCPPTFFNILNSNLVFCNSCLIFCFQCYTLSTLAPGISISPMAGERCQPSLTFPLFLLPVPKLNLTSSRMRPVSLERLHCLCRIEKP